MRFYLVVQRKVNALGGLTAELVVLRRDEYVYRFIAEASPSA
jgi:hypothetical protein